MISCLAGCQPATNCSQGSWSYDFLWDKISIRRARFLVNADGAPTFSDSDIFFMNDGGRPGGDWLELIAMFLELKINLSCPLRSSVLCFAGQDITTSWRPWSLVMMRFKSSRRFWRLSTQRSHWQQERNETRWQWGQSSSWSPSTCWCRLLVSAWWRKHGFLDVQSCFMKSSCHHSYTAVVTCCPASHDRLVSSGFTMMEATEVIRSMAWKCLPLMPKQPGWCALDADYLYLLKVSSDRIYHFLSACINFNHRKLRTVKEKRELFAKHRIAVGGRDPAVDEVDSGGGSVPPYSLLRFFWHGFPLLFLTSTAQCARSQEWHVKGARVLPQRALCAWWRTCGWSCSGCNQWHDTGSLGFKIMLHGTQLSVECFLHWTSNMLPVIS